MAPPARLPRPKVTWITDQDPFLLYTDRLDFMNSWNFRSAAIRGDRQVALQRVSIEDDYEDYFPNSFEFAQEESYLQRNLPMKRYHGGLGMNVTDPIDQEVTVPYDYSRSNPAPTEQKPMAYTGFELKWLKDLGKGGFGIASLWEATFDDGHRMKVVIKKPVGSRMSRWAFADERAWHERYRGAKNITQSILLAEIAKEHMTDPPKQREGSKGVYRDRNTIVLEFMEHDSLGQLNHNLAYHHLPKRWPNKALWQLFSALVRGLAEMAYLKHFKENHQKTFAESWDEMMKLSPEKQEEWFQRLIKTEIVHDVHFDMEEYNMLVGRDPDTGSVTFKLHDFSDDHSAQMDSDWDFWKQEDFWYKRYPCRRGRNLPEQHTIDWHTFLTSKRKDEQTDIFQDDDFPPQKSQCGGRYGMWSNVFIIAKTLQCCITGHQHFHPFTANEGTFDGIEQPRSYGWRLYDHKVLGPLNLNADKELKGLAAECMQEHPPLRPSLVELLRRVKNAQERGLLEDDDVTSDFWWAATDPKEYASVNSNMPGPVLQAYREASQISTAPFSWQKSQADGNTELDVAQAVKPPQKRFALGSTASVPGSTQPMSTQNQERMANRAADSFARRNSPQSKSSQNRKRAANEGTDGERKTKSAKTTYHSQPKQQDVAPNTHKSASEDVHMEDDPYPVFSFGEVATRIPVVPTAPKPRRQTPEWRRRPQGNPLGTSAEARKQRHKAAADRVRNAVKGRRGARKVFEPQPQRRAPEVAWEERTGLTGIMRRQLELGVDSNEDRIAEEENKSNEFKKSSGEKKDNKDEKSRPRQPGMAMPRLRF